jgi:hypothetical protein
MKALGIAAAAAIALAPFSVVAIAPVVAQATPLPDAAADSQGGQRCPLSAAHYRIPTGPAAPEPVDDHDAGADPTSRSATFFAPDHDSGGAADEKPTEPWWYSALHYGVLVTAVGLVAWAVGLSLRRAVGTPPIPPRPQPRWVGPGALPVRSALASPTIDHSDSETTRLVLAEAAHRCAVPTCRNPTTEIARIVPDSPSRADSFENLIALCPDCQKKEIDRQSIRMYKRNLGILNSRYSDFERRVFDQIAETDRRSFIVEAGLEIPLLHAVNDGLLKRVELSPVPMQRGEPTHHKYEVADAGLDFVGRYIKGEDISGTST